MHFDARAHATKLTAHSNVKLKFNTLKRTKANPHTRTHEMLEVKCDGQPYQLVETILV